MEVSPKSVSSAILTQDQLRVVLPRRTKVVHASMFKWALPTAVPNPRTKPKARPKAKAMPEGPVCSRTKKKGAVALG